MTITRMTTPHEFPEPPEIDTAIRTFAGPIFGFAPQPHLAEAAATTNSAGTRVVGVSLSYIYYRDPLRRDDPKNFVDLTPEQTRAIEQAESSNLPEWLIQQITRIRYPSLWNAVRTTKVPPGASRNALEQLLTGHANDVLRTNNPHHVPLQPPRAPTTGRLSPEELLTSTSVLVDGNHCRGRLLDLGAHTVALGARIDNRFLTIVYDRRTAPELRMEFATRHPAPPPAAP